MCESQINMCMILKSITECRLYLEAQSTGLIGVSVGKNDLPRVPVAPTFQTRLWGRLVPDVLKDDMQMADNRLAQGRLFGLSHRDCSTCRPRSGG